MAMNTIIILLAEISLGVILTSIANHQAQKEVKEEASSWAIIDGEFFVFSTEEA